MSKDQTLTADEATRLVQACSTRSTTGIRNRALVATLYRCGLRVSQLIALDRRDVDREHHTIRVKIGRGPHSRARLAGIDKGAFGIVERWIERSQQIGLPDASPLFPTLKGARLQPAYVRSLLARLAHKAGIEKPVSSEVLRRTLARELAEEGFPVALIQAQLGHADPENTRRLLERVATGDLVEAMRGRRSWRP